LAGAKEAKAGQMAKETKTKMGRPLKIDLKTFQRIADEYVEECTASNRTPLLTGLALKLDISKEAMNDYSKRPHYDNIIKRIDLITETKIQTKVLDDNKPVGGIFLLKAKFGYRDTQSIDLTSNGETLGVVELPSR